MKTILLTLCLFFGLNSYSQTTSLDDFTWYLERLVINNHPIFPPAGYSVTKTVTLNNNNTSAFMIIACWQMGGNMSDDQSTQSFTVLNGAIADNDGCVNTFDEALFYTFYEWQLGFPSPFSYAFINQSNSLIILTITNANGDQAIYWNQLLAIADHVLSETLVYPNPVADFLVIENPVMNLKKIEIYTMQGKRLKSISKNLERVDMRGVAQGVYFLKIYSNHGINVQKIVKK